MASHIAENVITHMSLMAIHSKKVTNEIQGALKERDKQISQLCAKIEELQRERPKRSLQGDALEMHSQFSIPPVTFGITDFAQHKCAKDIWLSPPFYSHPHGYKMRLEVTFEGKTFNISSILMRGDYDEHLQWPFQSDMFIRILNQHTDANHIGLVAAFADCPVEDGVGMQVTEGEQQLRGRGEKISYSMLDSQEGTAYLRGNTIQLQVVHISDPTQSLRLQGVTEHGAVSIPPCQFVMSDFEWYRKNGIRWYSPVFYTHPMGYKMCLRVVPFGVYDNKGTHVSLCSCIMRGEFDSHLYYTGHFVAPSPSS